MADTRVGRFHVDVGASELAKSDSQESAA
jgi:hypothetical protein